MNILDSKALTDTLLLEYMRSQCAYSPEVLRLFEAATAELRQRLVAANDMEEVRKLQGAIQGLEDLENVLREPREYMARSV